MKRFDCTLKRKDFYLQILEESGFVPLIQILLFFSAEVGVRWRWIYMVQLKTFLFQQQLRHLMGNGEQQRPDSINIHTFSSRNKSQLAHISSGGH